jgi:uncharacterized protein (TIGR03790 family)
VDGPVLGADAVEKIDRLTEEKREVAAQVAELPEEAAGKKKALAERLKELDAKISVLRPDSSASLDSELALVLLEHYPLAGWVANPLYARYAHTAGLIDRSNVMLVSRLDGPSAKVVQRVIDDSLAVEAVGLTGTAYFDARWGFEEKKAVDGYARYDRSIRYAARQLREDGRLPVVIDEQPAVFQAGACPDAALYCGWYSLGHYVPAFTWRKGAVGYHIASAECTTLKRPGSQVWCKRMLEEGTAATIGPVAEPYVQAFPLPEVFFKLLTDGQLSLVECYMASLPFLSWKMVLIGDPLYRPFGRD